MPITLDVAPNSQELGRRAAAFVAEKVKSIVQKVSLDNAQGRNARIIFATGASQFDFIAALVAIADLPWDKVDCFHLDEYVDLEGGAEHPASFRKYLVERLFSKMSPPPANVNLLDPSDIENYAQLLESAPIDLACIGIGENGHIAFNDPPVADFNDPRLVKLVELDELCRQQQVGEGWFSSLSTCPTHAATLTVPAIMRCACISCVVPDERKAKAVFDAINGSVSTLCPASIMRDHEDTHLWLDAASNSLLRAKNEDDAGEKSIQSEVFK